ncbi:hypothetical protein FQN54_001070 [Arachnomyces sp. PD_36]|nr:hypothetical protein FQN54_001070 [Arachnomyces sp. PD_36]
MGPFRFDGQPLDNNLVSSVACILDEANVPNVLWGNYLLTTYGVPTIVDGVAFAVPDELVTAAYIALLSAGFPTCMEHSSCRTPVDFVPSPRPTEHLHIDQDVKLSIFKQSETLWSIPALSMDSPRPSDQNIMLASDPRLPGPAPGRGRGAFSSSLYPVRIPTANRYTESLIRLIIRNQSHHFQLFWMAMLTYMLEYVDGTKALREDDLEPRFRDSVRALRTEGSRPYTILDELGKELRSETA